MEDFHKFQSEISNSDVDWAKHYDFYEVELREMYRNDSKPQNDSHFEMLKNKGIKYLTHDKIFCEIGFSAGLTLRYAHNFFGKVYGLDISPKNVELTKKELLAEGISNIELYASDLMKFDDRFENKFDVISFIHGLEHFALKDYPIVFNNLKKYLKPDGIFTGALPYKLGFNYRMCPQCNHVFEIDGHVSIHDKDSLKNVFIENGFKILHLDNYNLNYVLKQCGILKKVYVLSKYYLLKSHSVGQLEYIVKLK
ncbi:Methyltransferase domain protein [anaerobic digester metagenome]